MMRSTYRCRTRVSSDSSLCATGNGRTDFAAIAQEEPVADPLRSALDEAEPDTMSPREALEWLYRLKALAKEDG